MLDIVVHDVLTPMLLHDSKGGLLVTAPLRAPHAEAVPTLCTLAGTSVHVSRSACMRAWGDSKSRLFDSACPALTCCRFQEYLLVVISACGANTSTCEVNQLCSIAALFSPDFTQVLMCIGNTWQSHPACFCWRACPCVSKALYETGAEVCERGAEVYLLRRRSTGCENLCAQCSCRVLQCLTILQVGHIMGLGLCATQRAGQGSRWALLSELALCEVQAGA